MSQGIILIKVCLQGRKYQNEKKCFSLRVIIRNYLLQWMLWPTVQIFFLEKMFIFPAVRSISFFPTSKNFFYLKEGFAQYWVPFLSMKPKGRLFRCTEAPPPRLGTVIFGTVFKGHSLQISLLEQLSLPNLAFLFPTGVLKSSSNKLLQAKLRDTLCVPQRTSL